MAEIQVLPNISKKSYFGRDYSQSAEQTLSTPFTTPKADSYSFSFSSVGSQKNLQRF